MKDKEKSILDTFNLNLKIMKLLEKVLGRVVDVFEK